MQELWAHGWPSRPRAVSAALAGMSPGRMIKTPTCLRDLPHPARHEKPLSEKVDNSRFEVIHRACNLDAAAGFEFPKHRALFSNLGDGQFHVLSRHSVYERIVFGRAFSRVLSGFHSRTNLRQQCRQISKLHIV